MTSAKTLMPVDYYRLPFCQPEGGPKMDNENLGEFLAGDRIESSPFRLSMKNDMYCEQLCISNLGRGEQRGVSPNKVVRAIRKNYHNNWIVDNLSSASKVEDHYN
jgi:transmembrane 9 superfamily protein 2/4